MSIDGGRQIEKMTKTRERGHIFPLTNSNPERERQFFLLWAAGKSRLELALLEVCRSFCISNFFLLPFAFYMTEQMSELQHQQRRCRRRHD